MPEALAFSGTLILVVLAVGACLARFALFHVIHIHVSYLLIYLNLCIHTIK
jgi:hypothetical protein